MRLATEKDISALMKIALAQRMKMYPEFTFGDVLGGFSEQFTRPEVVVACTKDLSAYILAERQKDGRWRVRDLMPDDMPLATGNGLISIAMIEEHRRRPMLATTECYAELELANPTESNTADAYQSVLTSSRKTTAVDDKGDPARAAIYMTAVALAKKLKVRL